MSENRKPVGRITVKPKSDKTAKHRGIAAIWPTDWDGRFNVTFGDRETTTEEVLDMIESGDFYINMFMDE